MSDTTSQLEDFDKKPPTKGHPTGLYSLFFTEMWERFSYYGMRALLTLFLTAQLVTGGFGLTVPNHLRFTVSSPHWFI